MHIHSQSVQFWFWMLKFGTASSLWCALWMCKYSEHYKAGAGHSAPLSAESIETYMKYNFPSEWYKTNGKSVTNRRLRSFVKLFRFTLHTELFWLIQVPSSSQCTEKAVTSRFIQQTLSSYNTVQIISCGIIYLLAEPHCAYIWVIRTYIA
jgi:hypothetical protein